MKRVIIVLAVVVLLAGPSHAADWNFYGSARMMTFYNRVENNASSNTESLDWNLAGTSRIGAKVRVSDALSGRFEYGSVWGVNLRLLYGAWNFGPGTLRIGKDWTVLTLWHSGQVYQDLGLQHYGELGGNRKAQIKLIAGGFRLGLQETDASVYDSVANGISNSGTQIKLPAIAAKYIFKGDKWGTNITGGYSTFKIQGSAAEERVHSFVLGIGAYAEWGKFYLAASTHGGKNMGNLATTEVNGSLSGLSYARWDGTSIVDSKALAYKFVVRYRLNDTFEMEGGYGYVRSEYDLAGVSEDKARSYYLNLPITLADGVFLTPEVGVIDYIENNQDKLMYWGAKWQINF